MAVVSDSSETRLNNMTESDCVFCSIASGKIATELIAETPNVIAFRDIAPLAKVHLLVIAKDHHPTVVDLVNEAPNLLSEVMRVATELATEHTNGSFRLQFNTGKDSGQTVFHAHAHVLSNTPKVDF